MQVAGRSGLVGARRACPGPWGGQALGLVNVVVLEVVLCLPVPSTWSRYWSCRHHRLEVVKPWTVEGVGRKFGDTFRDVSPNVSPTTHRKQKANPKIGLSA